MEITLAIAVVVKDIVDKENCNRYNNTTKANDNNHRNRGVAILDTISVYHQDIIWIANHHIINLKDVFGLISTSDICSDSIKFWYIPTVSVEFQVCFIIIIMFSVLQQNRLQPS